MKNGYVVIDADGHVCDDEESIRPYVEPRFQKRPLIPRGGVAQRGVGGKYGRRHQDPRIQIEDMELEGIDMQVLYGTAALAMTWLKERELSVAVHRAYNDWLAEYCRHNPKRLKGVAALPMVEPEKAARELERAVTELGFVGGMAHTWIYNHHVGEPCYDELYACAEQYNVPIAFHASGSEIDRFDSFLAEHTIGHSHEQMCAALFVVYGGVLEKFRRLRVGFLEGMVGWIPFLVERMDEEYERRPHEAPLLTRKPSEYFKSGRVFFGVEPEEWMAPVVIRFLGTDEALLYASDYPHWDGGFPNTTRTVVEREDLTDGNKRNILGQNALRFYPALAEAGRTESLSGVKEPAASA
jgi:predicted TIM-barrel fold metal-dependent hydrolase